MTSESNAAGPSSPAPAPQMPPSPSNSFYAMSDDEEGEYSTITHTETGRGVKLLYSKSKVYIHPTPSAKDNIPGYIALLQQKGPRETRPTSSGSDGAGATASDLLLAWLPESSLGDAANVYVKVDLAEDESPPRQSYLVPPPPTVTTHRGGVGGYSFAIPVSAVYSLLVRPPSLGWWFGSVIINSRAGDSFPALFFHDSECHSTMLQKKKRARESFDPFGESGEMFWGGDEVLRWLRRYVRVERSGAEPNIYLIEPSREDSEAFGGKLTGASTQSQIGRRDSAGLAIGGAAGAAPGQNRRGQAGSSSSAGGGEMEPFMKFVKETGWNIMNQFSKVTTFTRKAAQDVLDNPRLPPQVRRLLRNPEVQTLQDEFDSARIYLARWAMGIAEQGERDRSQRIWTARDVLELEDTDVGEFELLESGANALSLQELRKPVTLQEWQAFFDPRTGRLQVTVDEVKERVFHGGLDPDDGARKAAWPFLLGVFDWHSSALERGAESARLRDEYVRLKGAWWERLVDLGGAGDEGEWWREQRGRIEKDVHRTDRTVPIFSGEDIPHPDPDSPFAEVGTNVHLEQMKDMLLTYNEFNKDLGYVQGMSDLLAPIYAAMQDDALAFWGFQHFMERMERNFLRDQSGMRTQLLTLDHLVQFMDPKLYAHLQSADSTNFFFFFRMLLVWYKREFLWMDVLHLWEVLWTDYLSSSFHLFVALAILEKHRDVIMNHLKHFDEVLKYVNELSNTMDLDSTLIRAEALFGRFVRLVNAVDKKGNFPAPRRIPTAAISSAAATSPGSPTSASATGTDADGAAAAASSSASPTQPTHRRADSAAARILPMSPGGTRQQQQQQGPAQNNKVITPELRSLLSREVEVLPRKVVATKGERSAVIKRR